MNVDFSYQSLTTWLGLEHVCPQLMNDNQLTTAYRLLETLIFAAEKHTYQTRKTGGSYITHPLHVAERLMRAGVKDMAVLQAAILHDTVEDTDATLKEIADRFGPTVARYVGEVSDDKALSKDERKRLQVEHAKTASPGAFSIKMADALDNLTDLLSAPPPSWDEARIKGYFVWKKAVFASRRGVNDTLETELQQLFARVIAPEDDEQQLLTDYYQSMAQCNETD